MCWCGVTPVGNLQVLNMSRKHRVVGLGVASCCAHLQVEEPRRVSCPSALNFKIRPWSFSPIVWQSYYASLCCTFTLAYSRSAQYWLIMHIPCSHTVYTHAFKNQGSAARLWQCQQNLVLSGLLIKVQRFLQSCEMPVCSVRSVWEPKPAEGK